MKQSVKKFFGQGVKIILAAVVLLFMGLQSLNFFSFVFPPEQWYYAYLGFGLTSGAVVAYLVILMTDADTPLRKTLSIAMLGVSLVGEVATAGFGMQVSAWQKAGALYSADQYASWIFVVQLLGLAHGVVLIFYFAGDKIISAFADDDGDGIPNIVDRHDNRKDRQPVKYTPLVTHNQDVPAEQVRANGAADPTKGER